MMTLPRFATTIVAATSFLALALLAMAPVGAQAQDEYAGLPKAEGRDTVAGWCGACHSLRLVSQQRLPRYRWEELLAQMIKKNGMPKPPPEDEQVIVDYLAENLGRPKRRRRF
jgi:mono/diheme cytochrome c family protein